ncbi:MAG: hypothetical protein FJ200_02420, partial [Gemmatimonadetes bacterium]|nr:hypothetical protein [Gemmatimonadota bacterium]
MRSRTTTKRTSSTSSTSPTPSTATIPGTRSRPRRARHDLAVASAMTVRVCTATGMRAREDQAFAAGASLYEVMRAAGEGTAAVILARYPDVRTQGAIVFVGTGNNGGDGWVIAGVLAHEGCPVQVESLGEP